MDESLSNGGGNWMFVDPPIEPLNEYDKRPAIKDVIEEHRQKIYEVKRELRKDPLYDCTKHDDLFIVRFVLSHCNPRKKMNDTKGVKKAINAVKRCLQYRSKYQLDNEKIFGDIRYSPPHDIQKNVVKCDAVQRYMKYVAHDTIRFVVPDTQRGVIGFLKLSGFDQQGLVDNVSEEDWIPTFSYFTEYTYQWLDFISRKTGRFTKSIRIVDTSDVKLTQINNDMNTRDGTAMKYMEDYYPQLLHKVYICNPPNWIQIPWRIIKVIFPKRLTNKIDFINPLHNKHEHNLLLEHISNENLPIQFGGNNKIWPVEFQL